MKLKFNYFTLGIIFIIFYIGIFGLYFIANNFPYPFHTYIIILEGFSGLLLFFGIISVLIGAVNKSIKYLKESGKNPNSTIKKRILIILIWVFVLIILFLLSKNYIVNTVNDYLEIQSVAPLNSAITNSVKRKDISLCNKAGSDSSEVAMCYYDYFRSTLDPSICSKIPEDEQHYYKNQCFSDWAEINMDTSICNNIDNQGVVKRDWCALVINNFKQYQALCPDIYNNHKDLDFETREIRCAAEVNAKHDKNLCAKLYPRDVGQGCLKK